MKKQKGFTVVELYCVVFVIMVATYCTNLVKLIQCDFEPSYKGEVIHLVGVVLPPASLLTVWNTAK